MNIQHSAPIAIRHDTLTSSSLEGVDGSSQSNSTDAYARAKSLNFSRTRSSSISPGLASPTPPTFVPDGSHQASRIGNYLLVEHVEGHNSGNVYRAVNINNEDEFICKVYKKEEYRKFIDGYSRVASHPNINHIVDLVIGSMNVYCFLNPGIAMQDSQSASARTCRTGFHAENLHSFVRSKKRLPESVAAPLFAQVVAAVSHCHQHNIVLRDLKLSKFIFQDEDRTKLMLETLDDVTILSNSDDSMFDRHGCPAYASPEILSCSAKHISHEEQGYSGKATDVWSLGVMLYTLLVGRYPFHEPDPKSMFMKISRGQYTLPESLSSEARDLLRNLLRRQPSQRLTALSILDHPWLKRQGNCWDAPRAGFSLGAGGDMRQVDTDYLPQFTRYSWGHSLPTSLYSAPSYEDQAVPETVPQSDDDDSQEMVFEFGE